MRIISLDVGEKRIGVARADSSVRIAIPVTTIEVNGTEYEKQYTLKGGSKNITVTTSTGDITVDFH